MGKRKSHSKSKSARALSPLASQSSLESDESYDVEVILKARRLRGGQVPRYEYYVQWYGYGPDDNSWQPFENLDGGCKRLLSSFWAEIGSIDKHYRGELKPSQEWIDAEVAYFRQQITKLEIGFHSQKVVTYNEQTGETNVYK
ncbi:hypothetical protein ACEPAH_323 [Sanghuangporus vaninii]